MSSRGHRHSRTLQKWYYLGNSTRYRYCNYQPLTEAAIAIRRLQAFSNGVFYSCKFYTDKHVASFLCNSIKLTSPSAFERSRNIQYHILSYEDNQCYNRQENNRKTRQLRTSNVAPSQCSESVALHAWALCENVTSSTQTGST